MKTPANFPSALLFLMLLLYACVVRGVEPAVPPTIQKRLDALKAGYESYLFQNVTNPHGDGLKALNEKVKPADDRALTKGFRCVLEK